MNKLSKEAAVVELNIIREHMLSVINRTIDTLINRLENGDKKDDGELPLETICPLNFTPSYFKGTKPTAVIFGDERIPVKTWRTVYALILERCYQSKHAELMNARNKINGRKRKILSDKPDGMDVPIAISEGLYAEADFDTEWLLRMLIHIMNAVRYDYNGISVSIKNARRR
jgi:hypothetical protein